MKGQVLSLATNRSYAHKSHYLFTVKSEKHTPSIFADSLKIPPTSFFSFFITLTNFLGFSALHIVIMVFHILHVFFIHSGSDLPFDELWLQIYLV